MYQALCFPEPTLPAAWGGPHSGLLSLLGPVFSKLAGWSCHLLSCKEMASPRLRAGLPPAWSHRGHQWHFSLPVQRGALSHSSSPTEEISAFFCYNLRTIKPMLLPDSSYSPFFPLLFSLAAEQAQSACFTFKQRKISGSAWLLNCSTSSTKLWYSNFCLRQFSFWSLDAVNC